MKPQEIRKQQIRMLQKWEWKSRFLSEYEDYIDSDYSDEQDYSSGK